MKKRIAVGICAAAILVAGLLIALKWDTIFQRGNPIPYLAAACKLSDTNTFTAVEGMEDTYITRRGESSGLFEMIREQYDVEFKDQLGSGYLFSDGEENYIVSSEIYWGRFTLWTLSFDDGFPN